MRGEAKVKGAGAPVRRRRQGRKSPGNNSRFRKQQPGLGLCGAGLQGGGHRLLLLLSKAQPGWGHGQMRWGKPGVGTDLPKDPRARRLQGLLSQRPGKTLQFPALSPILAWVRGPGKHSMAELRGIVQRTDAQKEDAGLNVPRAPPTSLPGLSLLHGLPCGPKRKLLSRPRNPG